MRRCITSTSAGQRMADALPGAHLQCAEPSQRAHSRIEDWQFNLTDEGIREMRTWEQFCRFAREPERRLIALCGVIGSGKTVMLRRLQQVMEAEKKITVSKSLAIEKLSIKLATFIAALLRLVYRKAGAHSDPGRKA